MNAMDKLFKLLLAAAAALFFTGCYSDYLNPGPARVYTRADFEAKGLEYISVGELKARFRAENAGMNAYRDTASSRGGRYHFTTTSRSVLSVSW